jgi:hypothetical protein
MLRSSSHPRQPKAMAQPKVLEKQPVAYWKPICAFRGLDDFGSINDYMFASKKSKQNSTRSLRRVTMPPGMTLIIP